MKISLKQRFELSCWQKDRQTNTRSQKHPWTWYIC